MDRMADIRIVASTSLIEINSSNILSGSNAIVYLSSTSANERGTFVTIRDVGGLCSNDRPIIVSTTKDISFFEGGIQSSFTIVEPYQSYLLSIRSSNLWSVVNTFSFPLTQSFASVSTLSTGIGLISSPITTNFTSTFKTNTDSISTFSTNVNKFTITSYAVNCNTPQGKLDFGGFLPINSTLTKKVGILTSTSSYAFDCLSTASIYQSTNQVFMLATLGNQVQFNLASDPLVWSTATFDQPINIHSIAYDGYRFIGVGTGGGYNMSFSQDGINWSNSTSAPFSNCYGIKYNGRQWLLLGEGTTTGIVYSSDGTTWNSTINSMKIAKDAIYDGRKWLAVGNPSTIQSTKTIQYSLDGITWSNITSGGFYSEGRGIGFNGSYYVATGKGSGSNIEESIQRSFDGINWSYTESCAFDQTQGGNKVTFHFPYWVVTGYCDISGAGPIGTVLLGTSGTDWSPLFGGGFDSYATDILWNGSYWIATGKDSNFLNCIQYSSNVGINQETLPPTFFYSTTSIQGSGDRVYGVFNTTPVTPNLKNNRLQINTQNIENYNLSTNEVFVNDYFTYLNKSLLSQKIPNSGSYLNGFVGINSGNTNVGIIDSNYEFSSYRTVRISTIITNDLEVENAGVGYSHVFPLDYTSTARISSFYTNRTEISTQMNLFQSTAKKYIALGSNNNIFENVLKSSDGFTYTTTANITLTEANTALYNGSYWLVGGKYLPGVNSNILHYSGSGDSWTAVGFNGASVKGLGWNGSYWLAGVERANVSQSVLRKSFDGFTWSDVLSNSIIPYSFKWANNNMWVMGSLGSGTSSTLILSYDGSTWYSGTGGYSNITYSVEYNGSMWIAIGDNGSAATNNVIKYSYNGSNWSNTNGSFYGGGGRDVKWNGTYFVAVGNYITNSNATIQVSYDGINWSNSSSGAFTTRGTSVLWDGEKWFATGENSSGPYSTIKYSYDGFTWSNIPGGFFTGGTKIALNTNPNPNLSFSNLNVYTNKIPSVNLSTNQISVNDSSIQLNSITISNPITNTVNNYNNNTVGINVTNAVGVLDVAGAQSTSNYPIVQYREIESMPPSYGYISSMLSTVNTDCATLVVPGPYNGPATFISLFSRYGTSNYHAQNAINPFFTGQHASIPSSNIDLLENIGKIVSADKGYTSYTEQGKKTGKDAIWITEALPNIKLTSTDKDPTVFGVITNYANESSYADNDNPFADRLADRIRVNGLGEGAIWITNINGNLENGDYICSSEISGFGRKQDDDKLHSYTVAKITMSCDFELNQDEYVCEELEWNGSTLRKAFVGCTYHCS